MGACRILVGLLTARSRHVGSAPIYAIPEQRRIAHKRSFVQVRGGEGATLCVPLMPKGGQLDMSFGTRRMTHDGAPHLFSQRRKRVSSLCRQSRKKGRTKAEVNEIIYWLTGHSQEGLDDQLTKNATLEDFFALAPKMNPCRSLITGVICGVRVEDIQEPTMQEPTMRENRCLDKLIDELAKGKALNKILRK